MCRIMYVCTLLWNYFTQRVSAEIIAYCATPDGKNPAQIEIIEGSSQSYQGPRRNISMSPIRDIKCEPDIQVAQPVRQSTQRGSNLVATPSSTPADMWPLKIFLKSGEELEILLEGKQTCKNLSDLLKPLVKFPRLPIPKEPSHTPVQDSVSSTLQSKDYKAGEYMYKVTISNSIY